MRLSKRGSSLKMPRSVAQRCRLKCLPCRNFPNVHFKVPVTPFRRTAGRGSVSGNIGPCEPVELFQKGTSRRCGDTAPIYKDVGDSWGFRSLLQLVCISVDIATFKFVLPSWMQPGLP